MKTFFTRRQVSCMRYCYVGIGIWAVFLVFVSVTLHLNSPTHEDRKGVHTKSANIFEKWYMIKRNLLEDDEDHQVSIEALRHVNGSGLMIPDEVMAVFDNTVKKNPESNKKVAKFLESYKFGKNPNLPDLDCPGILRGETETIQYSKLNALELKSMRYKDKLKNLVPSDETLRSRAENCPTFLSERKYILVPLSKEEKAYPIAYIITVHKDLQAFERLLRSIYQPQNVYCVHVDVKSDAGFKAGMRTIVGCFENVFVASNLSDVRYTHWSRVEADLHCMRDLVRKKDIFPWKYVINLCGQDFPIKTNLEIVRALKSLQDFNNLETVKMPAHKKRRYELHFDLPENPRSDHSMMKRTTTKKDPPPHGIEMFSGGAYYIFKRQAVEYILEDPVIQEFFVWNEDTYSPDEHMWATIQRMFPLVPGSYPPHEKYDKNEMQAIVRLVKWGGLDKTVYPKCEGRFMRGVCVFGCGDLAWLVRQHHLFANKFDANIDVLALQCLDSWLREKSIDQSTKYYEKGYL